MGIGKSSGWDRRDFFQVAAAAGLVAAAQPSESEGSVAPQPTPAPGVDLNTSDILVETLIDWGATHVFGIVGDGINSIIEALRKRQDRIRYVAVRHEEAAGVTAEERCKADITLQARCACVVLGGECQIVLEPRLRF